MKEQMLPEAKVGLLTKAEELRDTCDEVLSMAREVKDILFDTRLSSGFLSESGSDVSIGPRTTVEYYTRDSTKAIKEIREVLSDIMHNLRG